MRFGSLVTVKRVEDYISPKGHHKVQWLCECDCGKQRIAYASALNKGLATSCGCQNNKTNGRETHGMSKTRLYNIWRGMKKRCSNPANTYYEAYGGRGINVCEEWENDFAAFREWAIASGYSSSLTLDRIDNDKGYSPGNCRWVTMKEQNRNQRRNRKICINGETKIFVEWCEYYNIPVYKVRGRFDRGWNIEEALGIVPRENVT